MCVVCPLDTCPRQVRREVVDHTAGGVSKGVPYNVVARAARDRIESKGLHPRGYGTDI